MLFCIVASASSGTSKLWGKILDPQKIAVSGAHLKLINAAGAIVRETTSDSKGNFLLEGIEAGAYQLKAESDSFVTVIVDVPLAANQQKEIEVQFLQLASVLQSITVVTSAPSSLTLIRHKRL